MNLTRQTSKPLKRKWRNDLVAAGFLAPNIIGFLLFTMLPVVASGVLSFMTWDLLTPPEYVGLENFKALLGFTHESGRIVPTDPEFWQYLYNTVFLMLGIPISMAGSLVLAILLNRKLRGRVIFRTIYFLPSMCVPVAVFLLWRWIYDSDYGLLNWALSLVGLDGPAWLASTRWAKPALMLVGIWAGVGGYNMILFLAGLQNISRELYEAATIDGANRWQQFRQITWPLLTPTTFFILIISIIGGFQGGFEAAYMMTNGGPAGSTTTLGYYIYSNAFDWFNMGYAAAIAWVLFVLVFIVTLVNWRFGGKRVNY